MSADILSSFGLLSEKRQHTQATRSVQRLWPQAQRAPCVMSGSTTLGNALPDSAQSEASSLVMRLRWQLWVVEPFRRLPNGSPVSGPGGSRIRSSRSVRCKPVPFTGMGLMT